MFKPATKILHRHELHGDVREDHYFWMRERDSAPVLEYLRQENQRTKEALAPVAQLEKKLYLEMRARIKEDDSSVPQRIGGYWYYTRYHEGQEYPIHYRRKETLDAPEQVILDENVLAQGHEYFEVASVDISPDQRFLAYSLDLVGRRIYEIHFVDLETGLPLKTKSSRQPPRLRGPKTIRPYSLCVRIWRRCGHINFGDSNWGAALRF